MSSFLKWLFGTKEVTENKKKSNLPRSSRCKEIGEANNNMAEIDKKRKNFYAMAREFQEEAAEYGKKAALSTNTRNKESFKKKGIASLNRSRMYKNQAEKMDAMLMNYEIAIINAQSMTDTIEIANGMKSMNETMNSIKEEFNSDDMLNVMTEIDETVNDHADMIGILTNPISCTTLIDECDVENEFDSLMAEEVGIIQEEEEVESVKLLNSIDEVTPKPKTPIPMNKEENMEKMEML